MISYIPFVIGERARMHVVHNSKQLSTSESRGAQDHNPWAIEKYDADPTL